jgi:hypothetical protein
MTPYIGSEDHATNGTAIATYTLLNGTRSALEQLLERAKGQLPEDCLAHVAQVQFTTANTGSPYFPSSLKQTEAISALKGVEASVAASIANLRDGSCPRTIKIDMERASAFLFSTYLATVGGMGKAHPKVKKLLKGECT